MQTIALPAKPSLTVNTVLGGQNVTLNINTRATGLFMDVLVDDVAIVSSRICINQVPVVRNAYLGFVGDLAFTDTQGNEDPQYSGFGTRFLLLYLTPADLGA